MSLLTTWPAFANDSGDGISGSELTTSELGVGSGGASIKAAIEALIHSTTNPSLSPKQIIDEVVTARGNLASLNARLAGVIDADGAFITPSGVASTTQLKAALGSPNIVSNGEFDDWSAGASAAPDNWTLSSLTIARIATTLGQGQYMARLTRSGGVNGFLYQEIIAAADFSKYNFISSAGLKVSAVVRAKSSIASHARITIDDGITTSSSSYHTGGGAAETLSVTHTISGSATRLRVRLDVNNSNGDADFGGVILIFSQVAPTSWTPFTVLQDATSTRRGAVSVGAQTWSGLKTGSFSFAAIPTGIGGWVYARLTANFTKNNNTTLSDVTGLSFAVGANETWVFQFYLFGLSSTTAAYKFTLTGPAAPAGVRYGVNAGAAAASADGTVSAFGSNILANGLSAAPGNTLSLLISGLLRNGANAGTVQLQFAQNTAEVSDSIIHADSYVIATRVA